jgi:hypothetical protein
VPLAGAQKYCRNNPALGPLRAMIAITITLAAYQALKVVRPETHDATAGADGMIRTWVDRKFADRLSQIKVPGEGYSSVIPRLANGAP